MKLILATHIWVRWLSADDPLDEKIVKMIEEAESLAVSAVSCWEVAYLVKKQRLRLPMALSEWIRAALSGSDVAVIALDSEIAVIVCKSSGCPSRPGRPLYYRNGPGVRISACVV